MGNCSMPISHMVLPLEIALLGPNVSHLGSHVKIHMIFARTRLQAASIMSHSRPSKKARKQESKHSGLLSFVGLLCQCYREIETSMRLRSSDLSIAVLASEHDRDCNGSKLLLSRSQFCMLYYEKPFVSDLPVSFDNLISSSPSGSLHLSTL